MTLRIQSASTATCSAWKNYRALIWVLLGHGCEQVNRRCICFGKSSGAPLPEQHYAFLINDADELLQRLAAHDIEPRSVGEIPGVCRQVFVHDPSGNLVEFNQRLPADAT